MSDIDDRNPADTTASRLFDLRTLIGGLFVLYGLLLFVVGLVDNDQEIQKANGIRINLWLGLSMFVLGALFLVWVRLRPMRLERHPLYEDGGPDYDGGRRYEEGDRHDEDRRRYDDDRYDDGGQPPRR